MIHQEKLAPVSVRRQCELLSLNRSSFYYEPEPVSAEGRREDVAPGSWLEVQSFGGVETGMGN